MRGVFLALAGGSLVTALSAEPTWTRDIATAAFICAGLAAAAVSVLNGTIYDGYNGLLGWFWVACTAMTILLVAVARAALRERQYSAVMAATGLLYLAIVTAYGQDLVARILLAP